MMATDRRPYDPADLNMGRLSAYAKRVASETKQPQISAVVGKRSSDARPDGEEFDIFGAHWELMQCTDNGETNDYPSQVGEWHMRKRWILAADGSLVVVKYAMFFKAFDRSPGSWTFESSASPMTVADVLEMDHEHPSRHGENRARKETWSGNYVAGRRWAHAPGVGVSLALKKLLTAG